MHFDEMLKEYTGQKQLEVMQMRRNLVSACLEVLNDSEQPNNVLFSAISHLAEIPELDINIKYYEYLTQGMFINRIDLDVLKVVKTKLHDLDILIMQKCGGV